MVHPILPLATKGVIWYQGESNAPRAPQYRALFPALIQSWRNRAGRQDLPFIWVQLANFDAVPEDPDDQSWAELRNAQQAALALTHTAQVVALDVGDGQDIHPLNKRTVGQRLALAARRLAYGEDVVASGPVCRSVRREGPAVLVRFDHVAGGLVSRGGPLRWLEIAGPDGTFHPAGAEIGQDTIRATSPQVSEPVWVRYAWANNPEGCNLYSKAGLPAAPFRVRVRGVGLDDEPADPH
jgi:sialate O-acetylesterase